MQVGRQPIASSMSGVLSVYGHGHEHLDFETVFFPVGHTVTCDAAHGGWTGIIKSFDSATGLFILTVGGTERTEFLAFKRKHLTVSGAAGDVRSCFSSVRLSSHRACNAFQTPLAGNASNALLVRIR